MKFKSDIEVEAGLRDSSGAAGTSGQVLSSNGTTVSWINSGGGVANDVQNTVKAGVAINKGQAVYVTGADGTNIIVGLASNATEATSSKTLGLLNATVAINDFADVIQIGKLAGLDTSTATVGDPVWLGANGNLIYGLANKPYAPLHLVYIGVVTRVNANNGEIFINVQNGFELKEIHDVDIVSTPPSNNEILAFEGGSVNLWKNKSISSIGGITGSGTQNTLPKFTGTSTVGNSTITDNNTFIGMLNGRQGITLGADSDLLTLSNNTNKRARINVPQYGSTTGLPIGIIQGSASVSTNTIQIGGIQSGYSLAADGIEFYIGSTYNASTSNQIARFFSTGNFTLQNGGTFTDAGFRLDVNGTARVQGSINIGSSLSTISYNLPLSITLPAIGTKVAFLNVGINSVIKVELNGSENGFYQPMLLTISRNNTGASITINKDNPFFHENSNDISFSFDTATGDIYAEKIVYSTGRNFRISKVEVLFGTATVLNGTLTSTTNVGVDQTVTRIGKALYVTGANTAAQGNLTVAQGNVLIGTATASAFRLDVLGTTRLNGLQTFQGTTASDTAPLGSELAAVTGTGTGWTLAGTNLNVGGYTHTAGSVVALTTTLAAVSGTYYQIAYTITGRTAGSITINYGGTSISGITATGATGPLASSTAALTITPTTDFNGTVVLSIKSIGLSSATTTFLDSTGTVRMEIRANNAADNTFIGLNSGRRNTTGNQNTAFGFETLRENTNGTSNTALGRIALRSNSTGSSNTAIGRAALFNNTIGIGNTALGTSALINNTTGNSNTALGTDSLANNTTGGNNISIGLSSLLNITGNNNNTAIGTNAGRYAGSGTTAMTSVNNSIYLGYQARGLNATGSTNEIVIGYDVVGLGSNSTILGNSSTTTTAIYGNVGIGTTTVPNTLSVGMASSTTGKGISLTSSAGIEYARFGVINSTVDNTSYIGSISNNNFAIYANNAERMCITSGGVVRVTNLAGTGTRFVTADASGNLSTTTDGAVTSYNSTLTLNTSWQNTGIDSTVITTSGVYLVTCFANDNAVGGAQYSCTYVGTMYFYASGTNGVNANEIALHHSGHADNGRYIYLRTLGSLVADSKLYLQIKGNGTNTGNSTYVFTFKKLL